MSLTISYWPRLLADVGGTNARFALETDPFVFEAIDVLPCADYPSLGMAVQAYLRRAAVRVPAAGSLRHAGIAIANPVEGDLVTMTNHHWSFSIEALRCLQTVSTFFGVLGSVAGNLALTLGATGGVYIGGGIVPRLAALLENSPFRSRFEAKGRLSEYVARIPTYLISEPYPAFSGMSAILSGRTA